MKSKTLQSLIRTCSILFLLLSANHLIAQKCPCPGMVIDQYKFDQYTNNYEVIFRRGNTARHTQWIYLPRNYFIFLNDFLNANPSYKGISFSFVSHHGKIDPDQQADDDQIMFIASASRKATDIDYGALSKFYVTDGSTLWDQQSNQVELSSRINTATSRIGPPHIIFPHAAAIANYKSENPDYKYTRSVYVCKQQIQQIKIFLDSNLNYHGVKLNFASYNSLIKCVNNKVKEQFTLILVPVLDRDAKSDLNVYLDFFKKLYKEKFLDEYYNHGEMCPNSCPTPTARTPKKH